MQIDLRVTVTEVGNKWLSNVTVIDSDDPRVRRGANAQEEARTAYMAVDKAIYQILNVVRP